jgi:hypothetical protein
MSLVGEGIVPEASQGLLLYEGRGFRLCCAFAKFVVGANKTYAELGPPEAFSLEDPTLIQRCVRPMEHINDVVVIDFMIGKYQPPQDLFFLSDARFF